MPWQVAEFGTLLISTPAVSLRNCHRDEGYPQQIAPYCSTTTVSRHCFEPRDLPTLLSIVVISEVVNLQTVFLSKLLATPVSFLWVAFHLEARSPDLQIPFCD